SLGPADLAASRGMKTTRVGGGHPFYKVIEDPRADGGPRASAQQDIWHYTFARMVDACAAYGLKAFYGPFGAIDDPEGCEQQFKNAFLLGCAGAWTLHPSQIGIAKRVFSPAPDEVIFAKRILEAMPDGSGVVMLDGKMQDDATWKQAKVIVDLAEQITGRDPELAKAYGL
ncbi:MAG: HpcH/HpaI aldolase/citrate lyase family protein, partial [Microvirga sp.]